MAIVVHIMGRLGRDPVARFTASGQKVTSFSVASNVRRQNEEGTIWFNISVFGERFDKLMSYLKKGSSIYIVGTLDQREYIDKEGKTKTSLEVVADHLSFMPSSDRADKQGQSQEGGEQQSSYERPQSHGQVAFQPRPQQQPFQGAGIGSGPAQQDDSEDDLPF